MSNERDELAKVIYTSHRDNTQVDLLDNRRLQGSQLAWARLAADTLIASGWRKPRTITTAEEVRNLPNDSVLLSDEGGVFQFDFGLWREVGTRDSMGANDIALPATVIYEPEASK